MKLLKQLFITILLFILFMPNISKANEIESGNVDNTVRLYLFHRDSCPHCQDEIEFLDTIKDEYPTLEIIKRFYRLKSKNNLVLTNIVK